MSQAAASRVHALQQSAASRRPSWAPKPSGSALASSSLFAQQFATELAAARQSATPTVGAEATDKQAESSAAGVGIPPVTALDLLLAGVAQPRGAINRMPGFAGSALNLSKRECISGSPAGARTESPQLLITHDAVPPLQSVVTPRRARIALDVVYAPADAEAPAADEDLSAGDLPAPSAADLQRGRLLPAVSSQDEMWPSTSFATPEATEPPKTPKTNRLNILDRKVPWSWKPPLEPIAPVPAPPAWDDYDAADDFILPHEVERTPFELRWRARHPTASDEDLERISEIRMKKMALMQKSYCPSRYHFAAWTFLILIVLIACAISFIVEINAMYHDLFDCHRPLVVWLAAFVWTLIVIEPGWAAAWVIIDWLREYDVPYHARHRWWPYLKESVYSCYEYVGLYVRCGNMQCCSTKTWDEDDEDDEPEATPRLREDESTTR